MSRIKPWHLVVLVATVAALVVSVLRWLHGDDGPSVMNEITLVDPGTGELFLAKPGGARGLVIPATNPNTGSATLVPALHHDGKWFVNKRYFASVDRPGAKLAALIDRDSGEVKVTSESPQRLE
jgi:hypothetical protein